MNPTQLRLKMATKAERKTNIFPGPILFVKQEATLYVLEEEVKVHGELQPKAIALLMKKWYSNGGHPVLFTCDELSKALNNVTIDTPGKFFRHAFKKAPLLAHAFMRDKDVRNGSFTFDPHQLLLQVRKSMKQKPH